MGDLVDAWVDRLTGGRLNERSVERVVGRVAGRASAGGGTNRCAGGWADGKSGWGCEWVDDHVGGWVVESVGACVVG